MPLAAARGAARRFLPAGREVTRVAVLAKSAHPALAAATLPNGVGPTSTQPVANRAGSTIEITLPRGISVRVDAQVDSGALHRVLTALVSR